MQKIILSALGVLAITVSLAQNVDYNKIILPQGAKDVSIEERLVQLAWRNYPDNAIIQHQINIARYDLKRAQWSWLDRISAVGNLNEFTIKGRDDSNGIVNNFFPRYNFSVGLTLGFLVNTPLQVKAARENLMIEHEVNDRQKLKIRADVLQKYSTYKMAVELLDIHSKALQDIEDRFALVETKFRNEEATLNEYNGVLEQRNGHKVRKINAENAYMQAKLALEEIIGVRLEDVL